MYKMQKRIELLFYPLFYTCVQPCSYYRGKHMLTVFENKLLRKVLGPKNGEVTEE